MTCVHIVLPDGIDDPHQPSGGNRYDRRISRGLVGIGWSVLEHSVAGGWPRADAAARAHLTQVLGDIPEGALVLIDGLIASTVPNLLVREARRVRLVVLVHMPLGDGPLAAEVADASAQEHAVLAAAAAVVTTSIWTRLHLLDMYELAPERVHVAQPGVDAADLAFGTETGGELLCVAAVTRYKGHDRLLAALAQVMDLPWRCVCVGSLDREPGYGSRVRRQAQAEGIADRMRFTGARSPDELDSAYAAADVLLLASRFETYGMVVTEALARGLPVVATDVGGVPEALGRAAGGNIPGLLVPPDDPVALASALRLWLVDADLRARLRQVARERRGTLPRWPDAVARISSVLAQAAA